MLQQTVWCGLIWFILWFCVYQQNVLCSFWDVSVQWTGWFIVFQWTIRFCVFIIDLVVRTVSRTEWSGCFDGLGGLGISVD